MNGCSDWIECDVLRPPKVFIRFPAELNQSSSIRTIASEMVACCVVTIVLRQMLPVTNGPHISTVPYEWLLRISVSLIWLGRIVKLLLEFAQLVPGWPTIKSPHWSTSRRVRHRLEGQELIGATLSTLEHEAGIPEALIKLGQISSLLPLNHI